MDNIVSEDTFYFFVVFWSAIHNTTFNTGSSECEYQAQLVTVLNRYTFLINSAMDIKVLKILEFRKSFNEAPKQNGPDSSSTLTPHGGRKDKGGGVPVNSAPMTVPNKTEPKLQEGGVSPVPHYSKSYGERHMDNMAGQSKGFRRRHNSCESHVSLDF